MTFTKFFHYISYLQYPLMLVSLFYAFKPYLYGIEALKENPSLLVESANLTLVFIGLGISFSSLQDTTKTQNKFSKNIWESPKKGKVFIGIFCVMILFTLTYGLFGYLIAPEGVLKELSIGFIVLGLGMFGMLKAMVEMFENHRLDKNKAPEKK